MESEIVMNALSGMWTEEELVMEYDITFDKLDEIMKAHGYKACPKCRAWHNGAPLLCEDC